MFKNLFMTDIGETETEELIQLINPEEELDEERDDFPEELGILPIRNTVLFPGVVIPITVGRKKSIKLVKQAYKGDRIIGVVAQQNDQTEDPVADDLYEVGTIAKIVKMLVLPDGNTTIIIQGKRRFRIAEFTNEDPYFSAKIELLGGGFPEKKGKKVVALVRSLKESASKILKLNPEIPQEAQMALDNINNPVFLTHFLSSNLNAEVSDKQRLLEIEDGMERATVLLELMQREVQLLELKNDIQQKVHTDIDAQQRDYFLRQQMKVLQDELGHDGPDQELHELRDRAAKMKWPEEVQVHFFKELDKISRMNPAAAEFPVAMNYVEFLLDLPWGDYTNDDFDLKKARKILDQDHFGMEKVKERILEYLAVLKLKRELKGPILCLYGPPGVGKTSLGKSIARALNRKYIRMSLGGVHDEAEIRGHRKTYVGAMPGKVIQNIKKAGSSNPVFILDEIDKVNSDFRGDPASALLEVLDPEQNSAFADNYLEVDYDLSKILFVATANSLETIHPALRDRMEIIEINGYTMEEKQQIARRHLIPKQVKDHGLTRSQVSIDKKSVQKVIEGYTRESGVRNLERQIGGVIRHVAKNIAMDDLEEKQVIQSDDIERILGAPKFDKEFYQGNEKAGVVTGLAWTQVGGEILFIESSLSKGRGKLTLSGQLGDVMKESAMAALSYLKAHASELAIDHRVFDQYDLHVHVPAGAVPKDGPSAGITMFTSLASIYTQRKIKSRLAMTGEITLSGNVLPVGGIKEKILAAKRAGIKEIILCDRNRRDIEEIDDRYITGLTIHYVSSVEEVLAIALMDRKVKNPIKFTFDQAATKV